LQQGYTLWHLMTASSTPGLVGVPPRRDRACHGRGPRAARKVQHVDRLSDEDRALVKDVTDLVILKHRFKVLADAATPVRTNTGG
jgi:hypothetical protein